MDFDALIAPIGKEAFFQHFENGACMLIHGESKRFDELISLDDIEARINDGCNTLSPVQIIAGGEREAIVDRNLPWSSLVTRKTEVLNLIQQKHSFLMTNMSQINPQIAGLVDSIEEAFADKDMRADLHLYVSARADASAYDAHRDIPQHKLYLQHTGSTHWQIFEQTRPVADQVRAISEQEESQYLKLLREFELKPGDAFYMPPAVFHKVSNSEGPRISLSIPFAKPGKENLPRMDRTHIPFKQIFESDL